MIVRMEEHISKGNNTPKLMAKTVWRPWQELILVCADHCNIYSEDVVIVAVIDLTMNAFQSVLATFWAAPSKTIHTFICRYMFKYDTTHGIYKGFVESDTGKLIVDGHHIQSFSEK